ncbi:MAG: PRTRC system protein A [Burkholderiaceae bacterium]|nr:PRTRC system protein A [Burkholderiaceae bacterium]
MTDLRDAALLAACPVIAMPKYGPLPPLASSLRLVIAANGLFVQVRLPWIDCIESCGAIDAGLPLPYGSLAPRLRLAFGVIPSELLRQFVAQSRRTVPTETAAAIIYCARTGALRLASCTPLTADSTHIAYRLPPLAATEQIVVDLHSHGDAPAFFSPQDDADDRAIKICGVFGRVRSRHPEARFRLSINGMFVDLCDRWDEVIGLARMEGV